MLNILSIGDLHGRDCWLDLELEKNHSQYDYIVFLADYTDSFDISNTNILHNLKNVIELKKLLPEKVILLLGNHDIDYMLASSPSMSSRVTACAGFRPEMFWDLQILFRENRNLFQVAFQVKNYIWTHAGIHIGWYNNNIKHKIEDTDINLADTLNRLYEMGDRCIYHCGLLRGGKEKQGGILWAHKTEIYTKPLKGYHQIVGHTASDGIKHYEVYGNKDTSTTFIDCLDRYDILKQLEKEAFYKLEIESE